MGCPGALSSWEGAGPLVSEYQGHRLGSTPDCLDRGLGIPKPHPSRSRPGIRASRNLDPTIPPHPIGPALYAPRPIPAPSTTCPFRTTGGIGLQSCRLTTLRHRVRNEVTPPKVGHLTSGLIVPFSPRGRSLG